MKPVELPRSQESNPKVIAALQICRAMRNSNIRGTTYLIRVDRFIKIGFTKFENANARVADLQKACPFDFEIIAEIRGGKELECCLHDLFGELRVRDEWFYNAGDLKEFTERLEDVALRSAS